LQIRLALTVVCCAETFVCCAETFHLAGGAPKSGSTSSVSVCWHCTILSPPPKLLVATILKAKLGGSSVEMLAGRERRSALAGAVTPPRGRVPRRHVAVLFAWLNWRGVSGLAAWHGKPEPSALL